MGQGTPSVAPDQAKGAVPRPPSVSTPPRSRSAERQGSTSTSRTETLPRSRSEERSDGKGGDGTPTRQSTQTAMSWLDSSRRQSSVEPPREAPATGPIVIGGHDQQPSDPPQEEENRSSSPGMISRAISALSNMGRGPRPTRGRSQQRTVAGEPRPPSGDGDGDSSSYGSDVRAHQNPVALEPRIPAHQRPEVPIPPMFREDEVLLAGIQIGAVLQAQQEENQMLREHLSGMVGLPPPQRNQPPDERILNCQELVNLHQNNQLTQHQQSWLKMTQKKHWTLTKLKKGQTIRKVRTMTHMNSKRKWNKKQRIQPIHKQR